MDTSQYKLPDLMVAAIKAEVESRELYTAVSDRATSAMVKARFDLLAREEARHEAFVRRHFHSMFPGKPIVVPDETPVPMPSLRYTYDMTPLEALESAMEAETAAADFYESMGRRKGLAVDMARGLNLLANMERTHFEILRLEVESLRAFEGFDVHGELYKSFDEMDDDVDSFVV